MTDQQGQTILLFFHLSLMNPKQAQEGSQSVFRALEKVQNTKTDFDFLDFFVKKSQEVFVKIKKGSPGDAGTVGMASEMSSVDLGPWKDYLRSAPAEELLVLIWSQILKIPIPKIAHSLGTTEGTLKYRLNRASKKLGSKLDGLTFRSKR